MKLKKNGEKYPEGWCATALDDDGDEKPENDDTMEENQKITHKFYNGRCR